MALQVTTDLIQFEEYKLVFQRDVASREQPFREALYMRKKEKGTTMSGKEIVEDDLKIVYDPVAEDEQLPEYKVEFHTIEYTAEERGAKINFTQRLAISSQIDFVKYARERVAKQASESLDYAAYEIFKNSNVSVSIPNLITDPVVYNNTGAGVASTGEITLERLLEIRALMASKRVPGFKDVNLFTNFSSTAKLITEMYKAGWATESGRKNNLQSDFTRFNIFGIKVVLISTPYVDKLGAMDKDSYMFTDNPGVEIVILPENIKTITLQEDAERFRYISWNYIGAFMARPGERIWKIMGKA